MSQPAANPSHPFVPPRECVTCREPIHAQALKCKTCDGYQDWRRHLNLSSTVLALLVALVSVLTAAAPVVSELLRAKTSRLDVQMLGVVRDEAVFVVVNPGARAGTVASVMMELLDERGGVEEDRIAWDFQARPTVIAPGASQEVSVNFSGEPRRLIDRLAVETWRANDQKRPQALPRLRFAVTVRDFADGESRRTLFAPNLYALLRAGVTRWHRCVGSLPTAAWSGDPSSHVVPEQITTGFVRDRCGALPAYTDENAVIPLSLPQPSAGAE